MHRYMTASGILAEYVCAFLLSVILKIRIAGISFSETYSVVHCISLFCGQ